jgi:nitrogen fixation protein FixH
MAARSRRSLIPWVFPAAMAPVFAVNGWMAYLAVKSAPALVDNRPYEDGRVYNREIAAAAAQSALGWTADLIAPTRWGEPSPLTLIVHDRSGAPVHGLAIDLRIWRPVGSLPGLRLHLAEAGAGRYIAAVALPLPGQWQFDFVARRGGDEFVYARRVVVQ